MRIEKETIVTFTIKVSDMEAFLLLKSIETFLKSQDFRTEEETILLDIKRLLKDRNL